MKNIKLLIATLGGVVLGSVSIVWAINITVPSAPGNGYMLVSTTTGAYVATTTDPAHFGSIFATSSTATSYFAGNVTIVGTCTGCSSGSTASSTLLSDFNTFSGLNKFTNVGTTSFSGGLYASLLSAPYFHATSTTATSTFSGDALFVKGIYVGNGLDAVQSIITVDNASVPHPYVEYDNNFINSGYAGASWVSASGKSAFASRSNTDTALMASWSKNLTKETDFLLLNTTNLTDGSGWLIMKRADQDNRFGLEFTNYALSTNIEPLSILTSGNVGIGTTSPYSMLSVAGQVVGQNYVATSTTATSTFAGNVEVGVAATGIDIYGMLGKISIASSTPYAPLSVNGKIAGTVLSIDGILATSTISGGLNIRGGGLTIGTNTGLLISSTGAVTQYGGASCTNQFIRSLDASGSPTCATVSSGDVSLANLTATDSTLTFSGTYNGSTARTIGLNLGNANTWTALQAFAYTATTTISTGLEAGTKIASPYFIATSTTATSTLNGGAIINGGIKNQSQVLYPFGFGAMPFASSTLVYNGGYSATGTTTTSVMNPPVPIRLTELYCQTDIGTAYLVVGNGSATSTAVQCSTTGITGSANVTWTARQKFYVGIGTQASAPNIITLTPTIRTE